MKKTNKQLSKDHEDFIAKYLPGGRRTKASGAAPHDPGDVVSDGYVVECKASRKSVTVTKAMWEKILWEAHSGKEPAIAIRFVDDNDNPLYDLWLVDVYH